LLRVDDPGERAWAEDFLEMCLALQSVKLNPGSRGALRDALMQLAKNLPVERTMTHLTSAIQDEALRQALEPYTLKGGNPLLDQTSDSFSFKQWTMFEIGDLMEMGKHRLIPTMLYIFRQIERDLDGSPTLIPIDEGWLMLTEPVIMEWLKKWLKTLRKANAAVIFTTQNISDVGNSAIADVVFTNCLTKIYLADAEAVNKESKERYMARGFNERQVELLARAVPKRDYYYVSPLGKRMFQLGLHPGSLGLTVVGSGSKEEIAKAKDLMSKYGDRWFVQWLLDLGMKAHAEELDKRLETIL
jgi:type IV secretion system protein VirB4